MAEGPAVTGSQKQHTSLRVTPRTLKAVAPHSISSQMRFPSTSAASGNGTRLSRIAALEVVRGLATSAMRYVTFSPATCSCTESSRRFPSSVSRYSAWLMRRTDVQFLESGERSATIERLNLNAGSLLREKMTRASAKALWLLIENRSSWAGRRMTWVSFARSSAVLHTAHPSRRSEFPVCSTSVSERDLRPERRAARWMRFRGTTRTVSTSAAILGVSAVGVYAPVCAAIATMSEQSA
mmetsp:Transcript_56703/g.134693  ORF Transcript_56703/g.134693 Transcript_56703/m.134693 type:complete len:239 (-) Transcript_56703:336-1052(-)